MNMFCYLLDVNLPRLIVGKLKITLWLCCEDFALLGLQYNV
jgi:hypothetical protein